MREPTRLEKKKGGDPTEKGEWSAAKESNDGRQMGFGRLRLSYDLVQPVDGFRASKLPYSHSRPKGKKWVLMSGYLRGSIRDREGCRLSNAQYSVP